MIAPSVIPNRTGKAFYIRSAYRNDPEFQINQFQRTGDLLDEVRIHRMIDNDAAVGSNYRRLVANAMKTYSSAEDSSITLDVFREQVTEEIREPFARLFPDMKFNSLGNPCQTYFPVYEGNQRAILLQKPFRWREIRI